MRCRDGRYALDVRENVGGRGSWAGARGAGGTNHNFDHIFFYRQLSTILIYELHNAFLDIVSKITGTPANHHCAHFSIARQLLRKS